VTDAALFVAHILSLRDPRRLPLPKPIRDRQPAEAPAPAVPDHDHARHGWRRRDSGCLRPDGMVWLG
jgi:hypothetical protein